MNSANPLLRVLHEEGGHCPTLFCYCNIREWSVALLDYTLPYDRIKIERCYVGLSNYIIYLCIFDFQSDLLIACLVGE